MNCSGSLQSDGDSQSLENHMLNCPKPGVYWLTLSCVNCVLPMQCEYCYYYQLVISTQFPTIVKS